MMKSIQDKLLICLSEKSSEKELIEVLKILEKEFKKEKYNSIEEYSRIYTFIVSKMIDNPQCGSKVLEKIEEGLGWVRSNEILMRILVHKEWKKELWTKLIYNEMPEVSVFEKVYNFDTRLLGLLEEIINHKNSDSKIASFITEKYDLAIINNAKYLRDKTIERILKLKINEETRKVLEREKRKREKCYIFIDIDNEGEKKLTEEETRRWYEEIKDNDIEVGRFIILVDNCPEDILRDCTLRILEKKLNTKIIDGYEVVEDKSSIILRIINDMLEKKNFSNDLILEVFKHYESDIMEGKVYLIDTIKNMVKNENCPVSILKRISEHRDINISSLVAYNKECPEEILERGINRKNVNEIDKWREKIIVEHKNCPTFFLQHLFNFYERYDDLDLNRTVHVFKSLSKEFIKRINEGKNVTKKIKLERWEAVQLEKRKCLEKGVEISRLIDSLTEAAKFVENKEDLFNLSREPWSDVRLMILEKLETRDCPKELLVELSKETRNEILENILNQRNCDEEVLLNICKYGGYKILCDIIEHPRSTDRVIWEMVKEKECVWDEIIKAGKADEEKMIYMICNASLVQREYIIDFIFERGDLSIKGIERCLKSKNGDIVKARISKQKNIIGKKFLEKEIE